MTDNNKTWMATSESKEFKKVRTVPIFLAPFTSIAREIRGIFAVPLAFFGGIFGSVLLSAAVVAFFVYGSNWAIASDEESDELLEFEPGALVRLGKERDETTPEKQIVQETHVEEEASEEVVTKEEKPPEPEEKPKPKPKKENKAKEKPKKPRSPKSKPSDHNQKSNTPYNDLPTVDRLTGDPFGDPDGWAELRKDGDPWATGVMKALNGMQVPSWAAKGFKGQYKFELKICKDGRVDKVYSKGSSGDPGIDRAVQGELMKLRLPPPPAKLAKQMKSRCVKLKYRFVYGGNSRVR